MPRGQWSTQTRDHWGRCQDKESKVRKRKILWTRFCAVLISGVISCFMLSLASLTLFQSHLWLLRSHPSALPGNFLGSHPADERPVRSIKVCFKESVWMSRALKNIYSRALICTLVQIFALSHSHPRCSLWELLCTHLCRLACWSIFQGLGSWKQKEGSANSRQSTLTCSRWMIHWSGDSSTALQAKLSL